MKACFRDTLLARPAHPVSLNLAFRPKSSQTGPNIEISRQVLLTPQKGYVTSRAVIIHVSRCVQMCPVTWPWAKGNHDGNANNSDGWMRAGSVWFR